VEFDGNCGNYGNYEKCWKFTCFDDEMDKFPGFQVFENTLSFNFLLKI
jgi:hypothetical protein